MKNAQLRFPQDAVLSDGTVATLSLVEESDAALVLDHLEQLGGETDYLTFGPGELGLTLEQQSAYIAGLQDGASGFIVKAQIAGALAGCATIKRTPRPRIAHVGEFGLAVARAWWGRGLGKILCQLAIARARSLSISRIELRVRADNLRARHLYESVGFVVEGRAVRGFQVGGKYFDEMLMGLLMT
jgi:RimJ/RimL family protein N-acetyltransferase